MSFSSILFFAIAVPTTLAAVSVVVSRNIVRAAVGLLFTLVGVALTYFLLGAEFLAAGQLIVYVGGTLILVIFGVMLTAQAPALRLRTKRQEWFAAGTLGFMLFALLVYTSLELGKTVKTPNETAPNVGTIGSGFLGIQEASVDAPVNDLPKTIQPWPRRQVGYLLPFEIVSVHLLVVLIGAAYLARAKRKRRSP